MDEPLFKEENGEKEYFVALALAICLVDYGSGMTEALNKLAEMEKRQAEKSPKPKGDHANGDQKSLSGGA